jgi:glutathione S-transferase
MPTIRLTYFDGPGRAEPIRVALRLGGLPFEDHRLTFPEFMAAKSRGDFPLGSVPVLEVDGVPIAQTAAILRYVARVGDRTLYPEDPWAALVVDTALDTLNDTWSNALTPSLFERDPAQKLALRAALAAGRPSCTTSSMARSTGMRTFCTFLPSACVQL